MNTRAQRIADLRRSFSALQLAETLIDMSDKRDAQIAELTAENAALRAQLAQTWQPCVEDVDMKNIDGDVEFCTMFCGTALFINEGDCAHLPPGYAICKLVAP